MNRQLQQLDRWMAESPWHPRAVPYFVFILGLLVTGFATTGLFNLPAVPKAYPFLLAAIGIAILALLYRYRRLTPELTLRFHWTVLPSAALLTALWLALGYGYNLATQGDLQPTPVQDHDTFGPLKQAGPAWFWTAALIRLFVMTVVVALFEELFIRSAILRALHDWPTTRTGLLQLLSDLPVLGDMLHDKPALQHAQTQPPAFSNNLASNALGNVTVFATLASTVVFMLAHLPRDYAGCIACGIVWCWMVQATNQPGKPALGLGPVIWSHGLVNAALWAHALYTNDWQFL